jgi:signal transduction histidine kinase
MNRTIGQWRVGLRWKILGLFFLSALLTLASVLAGIEVARAIVNIDRDGFLGRLLMFLRRRVGIVEVGAASSIVLFVGFVLLLSRRSMAYLQEMFTRVDGVARGDLQTPIPVRSKDELGELAANLNRMVASLKGSMEEERRAAQGNRELITSVSHDLRTPLTSIIGYLGLITAGKYRDAAERERFAGIARRKALALDELVERLFEYTRLSSGDVEAAADEIDLGELVSQLVEEMTPIFDVARMRCAAALPPERVCVRGDGRLLMRVLENLLQNAARYGRRGGRIHVSVRSEGGRAILAVANEGDPIPPGDLSRIFDRLYRADPSRSPSTGGSGLGLAIAKSIVELHGGTIRASSGEDTTLFEVELARFMKT